MDGRMDGLIKVHLRPLNMEIGMYLPNVLHKFKGYNHPKGELMAKYEYFELNCPHMITCLYLNELFEILHQHRCCGMKN